MGRVGLQSATGPGWVRGMVALRAALGGEGRNAYSILPVLSACFSPTTTPSRIRHCDVPSRGVRTLHALRRPPVAARGCGPTAPQNVRAQRRHNPMTSGHALPP
eukprot:scaffold83613_cov34-Tisochrysis_lutea.AAC.3